VTDVPAPVLSPLARRLVPGIADFLFIGLLLTRIQPTLFLDGDTAWHLWAGGWFLAHGPGPIADPLSFTRAGEPWRSVQWLGEVVLALAYRHAGYMGVAVLCALVFAATIAWLYRILVRETGDPLAALLTAILAGRICGTTLLARPALLSLPLFLAAWQLVRARGRAGTVIGLPLVAAAWANTHPSAFLVPVLAAWASLARREERGRLALGAVLSALALGATPWGFAWLVELVPSPGNLAFFLRIDEWRTPIFREPKFWGHLVYVLVALAARRGARPLTRWETVWGLGWLAALLISVRLAPYAALAWAPYMARDLGRPEPGWATAPSFGQRLSRPWFAVRHALAPIERRLAPGAWPAIAGAPALAFAAALGPMAPEVAHGFSPRTFPERALAAADSLRLGPRVVNGYLWGGYLSWREPGRYRVFIDGRAGFFGEQVLADYMRMMELRPGWEEALARYRPDWVLVPPAVPLAQAAPLTGRWRAAYRDSTAVVLVAVPPGLLPAGGARP
jgi:hypothetical protein